MSGRAAATSGRMNSRLQSAMTIATTRHGPSLAITGKNLFLCRFLNDIDYMLCTRRDETENIGEWTFQSPIPESLWDKQSVVGGKR